MTEPLSNDVKFNGFASMDPDKQREIARKGGKAAHRKGTAHSWTSEEARAAAYKSVAKRLANQAAKKAGESDAV